MAPVEDLERALADGGKIDVQKKSGDWSSFVVASLGKPFDVDGVQMCYGYGPEEDDDGQAAPSTAGAAGRSGAAVRSGSTVRSGSAGRSAQPVHPGRDPSEPMPEYQGGPEDEWTEF